MSYDKIKVFLNNTAPNSQLLSVRVPALTINTVDELASELNTTRSDLVTVFINAGIDELLKHLKDKDTKENVFKIEDTEVNEETRYFLLNTNFSNGEKDHLTMLENGEASAFYSPWKDNIKYLKKGDIILLYQSGHGICGYGLASGELIIRDHYGNKDEWYSQKLNNFISGFEPITAKKCKEVTKSNMCFRRVIETLTPEQGKALVLEINHRKNSKYKT